MQMSVQQMVAGMGENVRNARVTTSTGVKILSLYDKCIVSTLLLQ